jgi:hypothetical protein
MEMFPTLASLAIGIKEIVIVITAFSVPKISTHQSPFSYSNWAAQDPTIYYGVQSCAVMTTTELQSGKWLRVLCNRVPRQFSATNSAHDNSAPTFQRIQIQRRDNSAH